MNRRKRSVGGAHPTTMSRIAPIPTTRVGNLFIRQRLVGQMQYDQLELLRLQTQISTGRRLQLASDDTPAAMRAINLQRVLDRKGQIQTNVHASNMFLGEAERRLGDVTQDIHRLRAEVVGVVGTVGTEEARQDLARDDWRLPQQFHGCRKRQDTEPVPVLRIAFAH